MTKAAFYCKPCAYVRWVFPIGFYAVTWLSYVWNHTFVDIVKMAMQMTTAFALILNTILTCQHIFLTEGRKTKVSLKDKEIDDGKGMHFTFPESKMWVYAMLLIIFYIMPMKLWYPLVISILLWFVIVYFNVWKPFSNIMKITQKSFLVTLIKCFNIANTMFEIKPFEQKK